MSSKSSLIFTRRHVVNSNSCVWTSASSIIIRIILWKLATNSVSFVWQNNNITQEQFSPFHLLPSRHPEGLFVLRASSLQQLVLLLGRKRRSHAGLRWHFDQPSVHCFDFHSIWQCEWTASPQKNTLPADTGFTPPRHFRADGWQSCPNAAEVVILIAVFDLWPFFFLSRHWRLKTCQTAVCKLYRSVIRNTKSVKIQLLIILTAARFAWMHSFCWFSLCFFDKFSHIKWAKNDEAVASNYISIFQVFIFVKKNLFLLYSILPFTYFWLLVLLVGVLSPQL